MTTLVFCLDSIPFYTEAVQQYPIQFDVVNSSLLLNTYSMRNGSNYQSGQVSLYIPIVYLSAIEKWKYGVLGNGNLVYKTDARLCEYSDDGSLIKEILIEGLYPEEILYVSNSDIYKCRFGFERFILKDKTNEVYHIEENKSIQDRLTDSSLSWDSYFMSIAFVTSLKSKDTNTKVGAVVVDKDRHIIGTGYNWFPKGVDEGFLPTDRKGEWIDTKYPFVVHAELNCILNSISSLQGSTMYVTMFPCNECAKAIIQSGITEIVYMHDKHHDDDAYVASRKLLCLANVKTRKISTDCVRSVFKTIYLDESTAFK